MPQSTRTYVILRHDVGGDSHWDLMLDLGTTLATWQLASDPAVLSDPASTTSISARRIGDHRRAYLTYEGPISGNRGSVTRVESGSYELSGHCPCGWTIRLKGQLLAGEFKLTAVTPDVEGAFQRSS